MADALKILHVVTGTDPKSGGVVHVARTLAEEMRSTGVECSILSVDDPSADYVQDSKVEIFALGPKKVSWGFSPKLAPWLKRHLGNYDIVVCHGLWQFPLLAVRREVTRLRKNNSAPKLFLFPHGMLDPWFQKDPSRKLKAARNSVYWSLIERETVNSVDAMLYTCEEEKLLARKCFPGYAANERVVGYGINSAPSELPEGKAEFLTLHGLPKDRPYFLFLSRIDPKKGVDLLIQAYIETCNKIASEVNGGTIDPLPILVIAGPTDSEYAKKMKDFASQALKTDGAERIDLSPEIHFVGMLQGSSKWSAIHGADLFVLPSHQENFGIAVVEALACRTPVLISNKVNIWREIEAGGGGKVIEDDLLSVKEGLEWWLDLAPEKQEAFKRGALGTFRRNFELKTAIENLSKVFAEDSYSN